MKKDGDAFDTRDDSGDLEALFQAAFEEITAEMLERFGADASLLAEIDSSSPQLRISEKGS
ncbi:MAG: hypothetical protein WBX15_15980 [Thermoanaerobaculia bacterium]